jgi:hypothetical protein
MVYCLASKWECEQDDSETPNMLADNISDLLDMLQAIVEEEREELNVEASDQSQRLNPDGRN